MAKKRLAPSFPPERSLNIACRRVHIDELGEKECRWPLEGKICCGLPVTTHGKSYCSGHLEGNNRVDNRWEARTKAPDNARKGRRAPSWHTSTTLS